MKAGANWPATAAPVVNPKSGEYVITPEQRAFWSFQPLEDDRRALRPWMPVGQRRILTGSCSPNWSMKE